MKATGDIIAEPIVENNNTSQEVVSVKATSIPLTSKQTSNTSKIETAKKPTTKPATKSQKKSTPKPTPKYTKPKNKSYANETFTVYDSRSRRYVTLDGFTLVCQIVRNEVGSHYTSGSKKGQTVYDKETIKAHAVATFTYLKYSKAKGQKPSFSLKKDVSQKIKQYVKEVDGKAIYYDGKYICAVYCTSAAGTTLSSHNSWGSNIPYLKSVPSKYDYKGKQFKETKVLSKNTVKNIIQSKTGISVTGDPANWFSIAQRVDGNYVKLITICGKSTYKSGGKTYSITGTRFREKIMGGSNVFSPAFDISYRNNKFYIVSYGYGHGIGMPSEGAELYARNENWNWQQILTHYYTGVSIG